VTDFDPALPYNELPELPPPLEAIETTEILKRCIKARVALAELKQAAELIPNSAVLRSGERNLVFVDLGEGRFAPREVKLGVRGEGDSIQIVSGLGVDEAVVTQAQFMLDSESRVQEAIAKFLDQDRRGGRE